MPQKILMYECRPWWCMIALCLLLYEASLAQSTPAYQEDKYYLQAFEELYVKSDFGAALAHVRERKAQLAKGGWDSWAFQLLEARALFHHEQIDEATQLLQAGIGGLQESPPGSPAGELLADYHLLLGIIAGKIDQDSSAMEQQFAQVTRLMRRNMDFRQGKMDITRSLLYYHLGMLPQYQKALFNSFARIEAAYLESLAQPFPSRYQILDRKIKVLELSKALFDIAYYMETSFKYQMARFFYAQGHQLILDTQPINTEKLLYSLFNQAYFNYSVGDNAAAEDCAEKVLKVMTQESFRDASLKSGTLQLLGDIRVSLGDYEMAERYYQQALELSQQSITAKPDKHYIHASVAKMHYGKGEYSEAVRQLEWAMKECPAASSEALLNYELVMTQSYAFLDARKAKTQYKDMLARLAGMGDSPFFNYVRQKIYYELGHLEKRESESISLHLASREQYRKDSTGREVACLNLRALAKWHQTDTVQYQRYMTEAIRATLREDCPEGEALRMEAVLHHRELLGALQELGDYYKQTDPLMALGYWQQAAEVSEWAKPLYRHENSRKALAEASIPIYDSILSQWADLYLQSGSEAHFQEAFSAAELSQSILLKDALMDSKAVGKAGIPDEVFQKGKELQQELATQRNYYNENGLDLPPEEKEQLNQGIVEASIAYEQFQSQLKEQYPKYYALKFASQPVSLPKIQAALPAGGQLLEYHLKGDTMYVFSITPTASKLWMKPVESTRLARMAGDLYRSMKSKGNNRWESICSDLHGLLLSEVLQPNTQHLVVIPHGVLHYVPFGLLCHQGGRPHLPIQYAYTALQIQEQSQQSRHSGPWLGLAPSYDGTDWASLPFAQQESKEIHEVWGGEVLEGADATLGRFEEKMREAHSMVHIAGHAEANLENPLMSRLVLTATEEGGAGDLFAHQLYHMNVQADLVTLSACHTGYGSIIEGEGVMSLARGFAYAGCPATVTTLWPVDDQTTRKIMVQFYKNLKKGMGKAKALSEAKGWFLKNNPPKFHHPYYWAGIVFIGSDTPIQDPSYRLPNWKWMLAGLLVLVLVFANKGRLARGDKR